MGRKPRRAPRVVVSPDPIFDAAVARGIAEIETYESFVHQSGQW